MAMEIIQTETLPRPMTKKPTKPTIKIKPSSYRPTKAELEADVSIQATPEELVRAVMRPMRVRTGDIGNR